MNEKKHIDPTALGLFGLAIVTLVASSTKLGFSSGDANIIPWAIFLGGIAQLVAGILDYKNINILGATAFFAYGLFWIATSLGWYIAAGGLGEVLKGETDPKQMALAYLAYAILSIFLTIGATETNKLLFVIFIFIDILFISLSLAVFGIASDFTLKMAGAAELVISILSFYGSGANVLNNHFNKAIFPIGKPLGLIKKA